MKSLFTMSLLLLAPLFLASQVTLSSTTWKYGEPVTISWKRSGFSFGDNLAIQSDAAPSNPITIQTRVGRSGSLRYTPSKDLCGNVRVGIQTNGRFSARSIAKATIGSTVKISNVRIDSDSYGNPRPNSKCVITFYASIYNSCDRGQWEYQIGTSGWKRPTQEIDNFDSTGPTEPTKENFKVSGFGSVPNIKGSTTLTIRVKLGTKYFTGNPVSIQIASAAKPEEVAELNAVSNSIGLKSENIKPNTSFLMYPNPSDSQVNISINSSDDRDYTLSIKDIYGRTILSQADKLFVGSNTLSLNVAGLSPGMYILSMLDKSGLLLESQKLQIVR